MGWDVHCTIRRITNDTSNPNDCQPRLALYVACRAESEGERWQNRKMSKYASIQAVLDDWAQAHGLHLFTQHQDEEVRSSHIVDDKGTIYGVWISPPSANGKVTIGAASHRKHGTSVRKYCAVADLRHALESVYEQVEEWITEAGSTRTPVR